jgi:hypothetical protein
MGNVTCVGSEENEGLWQADGCEFVLGVIENFHPSNILRRRKKVVL